MRLHDIQVIYSSSDNASKFQAVTQQQGQINQSQTALALNSQQEIKDTQVQNTEENSTSKGIAESEQRFREWQKEKSGEKRRQAHIMKRQSGKEKDEQHPDADHIIDIKV